MTEENKTNITERLIVGAVLTIIGLLGLSSGMGFGYAGYGFGSMGGMMGPGMMGSGGMMGGYGYGSSIVPFFVLLVFLAVTLFGLYIIYDALKRSG